MGIHPSCLLKICDLNSTNDGETTIEGGTPYNGEPQDDEDMGSKETNEDGDDPEEERQVQNEVDGVWFYIEEYKNLDLVKKPSSVTNAINNERDRSWIDQHTIQESLDIVNDLAIYMVIEAETEEREIEELGLEELFSLWKGYNTYSRMNAAEEGEKYAYTNTLGLVAQPTREIPAEVSKLSRTCPWVLAILNMYVMTRNCEDVKWTSVTINRNLQCPQDKDKNNEGLSLILAVGDFTGGGLHVWESHKRGGTLDVKNATTLDTRELQHYYGRKYHATEALVDGEKFSYGSHRRGKARPQRKPLRILEFLGVEFTRTSGTRLTKINLEQPSIMAGKEMKERRVQEFAPVTAHTMDKGAMFSVVAMPPQDPSIINLDTIVVAKLDERRAMRDKGEERGTWEGANRKEKDNHSGSTTPAVNNEGKNDNSESNAPAAAEVDNTS